MKNVLDGFISRVDTTKKRFSDGEDLFMETFHAEMQRKKENEKQNRASEDCGPISKSETHT